MSYSPDWNLSPLAAILMALKTRPFNQADFNAAAIARFTDLTPPLAGSEFEDACYEIATSFGVALAKRHPYFKGELIDAS